MTTAPRPLAANRENANKSTGPEAAARTSHNDFVEDKTGFLTFHESAIAYYKPQDVMEEFFVEMIARGQWRIKLFARCESAIHHGSAIEAFEANSEDNLTLEQYLANLKPAEIFTLYSKKNQTLLKNFRRYKSQANRTIRFAIDSLADLRKEARHLSTH